MCSHSAGAEKDENDTCDGTSKSNRRRRVRGNRSKWEVDDNDSDFWSSSGGGDNGGASVGRDDFNDNCSTGSGSGSGSGDVDGGVANDDCGNDSDSDSGTDSDPTEPATTGDSVHGFLTSM